MVKVINFMYVLLQLKKFLNELCKYRILIRTCEKSCYVSKFLSECKLLNSSILSRERRPGYAQDNCVCFWAPFRGMLTNQSVGKL